MLKGGLVLIWELDMNLELALLHIHLETPPSLSFVDVECESPLMKFPLQLPFDIYQGGYKIHVKLPN